MRTDQHVSECLCVCERACVCVRAWWASAREMSNGRPNQVAWRAALRGFRGAGCRVVAEIRAAWPGGRASARQDFRLVPTPVRFGRSVRRRAWIPQRQFNLAGGCHVSRQVAVIRTLTPSHSSRGHVAFHLRRRRRSTWTAIAPRWPPLARLRAAQENRGLAAIQDETSVLGRKRTRTNTPCTPSDKSSDGVNQPSALAQAMISSPLASTFGSFSSGSVLSSR